MFRVSIIVVLILGFFSPPAYAENTSPSPQSDPTGHYYLQGVREIGSELILAKSGEFQWALMYGATDLFAKGTWRIENEKIVLTAKAPAPGKFRLFDDSEFNLRKGPRYGTWVAIVGVPRQGPIPGIEVQFESMAGRSAIAVSDGNGDAIVVMPSSEAWKRVGVRRADSGDEWVWIDVPDSRSRARIAGIAVMNPQELQRPPFKSLTLLRKDRQLVIDSDTLGFQGVYEKELRLAALDASEAPLDEAPAQAQSDE